MLNINDYVEMSKEDFLNKVEVEEKCPADFNLKILPVCNEGLNKNECRECWNKSLENINFFNPVAAFENNAVMILDDLAIMENQYQILDEGRKDLKNKLMIMMEQYGVEKFENDKMSLTYVKGSTGIKFDSAKLKKEHKDLFEAYQVPAMRAASLRFKVK